MKKGYVVIGFYVHYEDEVRADTVMTVIDEGHPDRLTYYCPIGQHSEGQRAWLNECRKISKKEYLEASKGIYTPEEYISDGEIESLWIEFADVPFDDEELAEDWHIFHEYTEKETIWKWFDEMHTKGVAWLLYDFDWREYNA